MIVSDPLRNSPETVNTETTRNNAKQPMKQPETTPKQSDFWHRNSRNNPLRGGVFVSPIANALARIPEHPAKHPHAYAYGYGSGRSGLPLFGWLCVAHAGALVLMVAFAIAAGVI
jgi:hypothetical protein